MSRGADVCFLWHMHQPQYVDVRSGKALLPWVRVHSTRAYLDMARLLGEHPAIRATVNFVPSLVDQIEAYVGGAVDAYEEVSSRPADALTADEREFIVARFFSVHWGRLLEPVPRYRELLEKRGRELPPGAIGGRARRFTAQDLRDLCVLFQLAQLGSTARREDEGIERLLAKGRDYGEEDKLYLARRQREIAAGVLPAWRELAARGQVELTASPYYHPIVPLLVDSETSLRAMPGARQPPRFRHPEDGREQIVRARARHERAFGAPPAGMWPPEGSISPEALALYAGAGIRFVATDEGNLARSLPDGLPSRAALYRPYRFESAEGPIDLVFRDRELSDRIGFAYACNEPRFAAQDLAERLRAIADGARSEMERPLVTLALDGENAWEAYESFGEPFLRQLYERLGGSGALRTRTLREALEERPSRERLSRVHSGSWIDASFQIWIGDPDKNRAWQLLGRLRDRLAEAERRADPGASAAREHVLAAEGSDWFWWFGEPFHSAEDAIFDALFRSHLRAAYRALGEAAPAELDEPVGHGRAVEGARPPRRFIHPRIDGEGHSFYEWEGAGLYAVPKGGGAMSEGRSFVERIYFGFDAERLYLRLDPPVGERESLTGAELRVTLRAAARELWLTVPLDDTARAALQEIGPTGPEALVVPELAVAARDVVEVALPFGALGFEAGGHVRITLRLRQGELTLARYPRDGYLEIMVPDATFELLNWSV